MWLPRSMWGFGFCRNARRIVPDLVVRGASLVTPSGTVRADLAVEDGRICGIAPELGPAREEIDAHGLAVLPGLIDVHLHFNEPGREDWEGAATGSRALAAGGGVAFFDMPLNSTPCTVGRAEFEAKRCALEKSSITDFGLWGGIVPGNRDALGELAECGAIGFKAFMADSGLPEFPRADDLTLFEGMRAAARVNLPVAVHAESQEITQALARRALAEGRRGDRDFLNSRPVLAEVEAIERAGLLAREAGAKLHVVHVSSGRGVAAALEARTRGTDISIETCAHYLFFTEEDVERLGAVAKCAPPLRDPSEQAALWDAVLAGQVDVIASDHSPAPPAMKLGGDFFGIWGGIAGAQCTLAVLLEAGFHTRGLDLGRIAELTAAYPARRFRLQGKGGLAVGNDADFVLVDLEAAYTLEESGLFQKHRLTPYVSVRFRGAIRRTVLRGRSVFVDARIMDTGGGRMLRPAAI
jgi:allantoinase